MQKVAKRNPKLVQAYILEKQMGGCELYHHIEGETWDHVRESWAENGCSNPDAMQVEPHHIFGGPHRWDVETNLIAVCRPVHDWAERYDKQAATIAAIWVKLRNGVRPRVDAGADGQGPHRRFGGLPAGRGFVAGFVAYGHF